VNTTFGAGGHRPLKIWEGKKRPKLQLSTMTTNMSGMGSDIDNKKQT